jgi:hypothetical protein
LEIGGKVCVGQFHRTLFEQNEYVICIVRWLENNLYELYSVLSPKAGLLHMQVGIGASVKTHDVSTAKGRDVWYGITIFLGSLIYFWATEFNQVDILIFFQCQFYSISFYFLLLKMLQIH